MKKRLLICLERLDIGGVETSVLNQVLEYKKRGYNVTIMAQNGTYTKIIQNEGIECIDYKFSLEDRFIIEQEKYIKEVIDKRKITEVHIHQYPCIIHLLPVLLKNNIPYVAFVHTIVDGTYEWYMNTYEVYNLAFKLFFENASKIVTIREKEIRYNKELFNIKNKSKYFVLKNSIDFSQLPKNEKIPKKIKNFLLISRISEEKLISIEKGIEFFKSLKIKNKKLSILGEGKELEYLKEKYQNEQIVFLGKTNKVFRVIKKYDAVIGVDRCILEAICCRKLAIISSYDGLVEIVDEKNIEFLSKENFSGKNLKKVSNVIERINDINSEKYKKIVDYNYEYAYDNFNISKNIFDEELENKDINYNSIFECYNSLIQKAIEEKKENYKIKYELDCIKNNRSWKLTSTIIKNIKKIIKFRRGE